MKKLTYSKWCSNCPHNIDRAERCVHFWPQEIPRWNDYICSNKIAFGCMKRKLTGKLFWTTIWTPLNRQVFPPIVHLCPDRFEDWVPGSRFCYNVFNNTPYWILADRYCKNLNATLIRIDSRRQETVTRMNKIIADQMYRRGIESMSIDLIWDKYGMIFILRSKL